MPQKRIFISLFRRANILKCFNRACSMRITRLTKEALNVELFVIKVAKCKQRSSLTLIRELIPRFKKLLSVHSLMRRNVHFMSMYQ
jgi:hypothetical protein